MAVKKIFETLVKGQENHHFTVLFHIEGMLADNEILVCHDNSQNNSSTPSYYLYMYTRYT